MSGVLSTAPPWFMRRATSGLNAGYVVLGAPWSGPGGVSFGLGGGGVSLAGGGVGSCFGAGDEPPSADALHPTAKIAKIAVRPLALRMGRSSARARPPH